MGLRKPRKAKAWLPLLAIWLGESPHVFATTMRQLLSSTLRNVVKRLELPRVSATMGQLGLPQKSLSFVKKFPVAPVKMAPSKTNPGAAKRQSHHLFRVNAPMAPPGKNPTHQQDHVLMAPAWLRRGRRNLPIRQTLRWQGGQGERQGQG